MIKHAARTNVLEQDQRRIGAGATSAAVGF